MTSSSQDEGQQHLLFAGPYPVPAPCCASLASVHTGAWQMDQADGSIQRNLEHDKIFGYEDLQPQWSFETFLAHVVPEDRQAVNRHIRQALETGGPWTVECRIRRYDGAVRWIMATGSRLREEDGEQPKMAGIVQDITGRKQDEAELRASEERYRQVLASMSEGYAILSPDWTYLFVNKVNAQQAHSTPEDMVGRNMLEVIPGVEKSPFFEAYRRCMEERTPQRVESAFTYEDGSLAWFEAVAEPVAEGISVRAQNITARKRSEHALRESEELVRTIAENSTQALVMMNEGGYATYWNPALLAMTGYTAEELRSMPLHDLIHHHYPDGRPYPMAECPIDRALPENFEVRAHEDLFFRKDGTAFPVLCAASPVMKGGKSVGTVVEVRDVTERKHAEEALREAHRRKDHFLAVLSHELRNPLAPIKNSLYILGRVAPGGDQARKALDVIERQVDQLTNLVDDLLDLTRIARGKVQLERRTLELNDLVRRSLEDHLGLFERSGVRAQLELAPQPVLVDADWNRMSQVIGNLLQNAAKFTPRDGSASIVVSADPSRDQALIRVADTGVGMAPQMVQRLFEPFAQADDTLDRSKGGLGLGLALVKQLVELHGGSVEARTGGLGAGAEFLVRLPLATARTQVAGLAPPSLAALRRRVLLIEDNVDAAESLRTLLELQGHEVEVAYNGPDGLAKARDLRPEVVLCDIGLPGMDGYEVARVLRADEALKGMRLVALSGYTLPDDLQRAAAAGFEQHLAKPPSLEMLEGVMAL